MKKIILISTLILSIVSCRAQVITPIFGSDDIPDNNPNNYYKDVDNDMNKFEGTWKYINGDTEFKIVLVKKLAVNDNDGDYIYDLLIGEYLYKENNVIIVNTLVDINNTSIRGYQHNISGNLIMHNLNNPRCPQCNFSERRISLSINKPNDMNASGYLTLRYLNINGVQKLEAILENASIMGSEPPAKLDMPDGNYIFIKE